MDSIISTLSTLLPIVSIIATVIYLTFDYYRGDSLTKFLSSSKDKIFAFLSRQLGIIAYDSIVVFSIVFNYLSLHNVKLSDFEKNDYLYLYLIFILFFIIVYPLSIYVLHFFKKYLLYNEHTVTKKSNFYILLNSDINKQFKKNNKVILSIPSKKEILCYKEINEHGKTNYLRIYLPINVIKEHTIFSEKKPSPIETRDKARGFLLADIKKSKSGTIPVLLLFFLFIFALSIAILQIYHTDEGSRLFVIILYSIIMIWVSITIWWATGPDVIEATFKKIGAIIKKTLHFRKTKI